MISVIKHPEKKYFDKVYVSANPFPTIVAYERANDLLRSYSLSGLLIKEKKMMINHKEGEKTSYNVRPLIDLYGGNFKDRLIVYNKDIIIYYSIPFFEEEPEDLLSKENK